MNLGLLLIHFSLLEIFQSHMYNKWLITYLVEMYEYGKDNKIVLLAYLTRRALQ